MFEDSSSDEVPPVPSSGSSTQSQDMKGLSQPEAGDLGGPASLDPQLESFLRGEECRLKPMRGWFLGGITQQPPFEDSHAWVAWRAEQVNTPTWWPELKVVPH